VSDGSVDVLVTGRLADILDTARSVGSWEQ